MKQPKTITVNWIEDLTGRLDGSKLIEVAKHAKKGKIQILDTMVGSRYPFMTIVYEERSPSPFDNAATFDGE